MVIICDDDIDAFLLPFLIYCCLELTDIDW